ncbi:MAG: NADH-quinone oxidoreductase subunit L [Methanobacteriota archaeon]
MDYRPFAYLIILLPFLGFVLELFFGKYSYRKGGIFANLTIAGALLISLGLLYNVYFQGMPFYEKSWDWFFPGIVFGIVVDPLSIVMACMVSFVGLLIHIFALGYMGEDPNKSLYFAETALFTGGMLGLVLSNNFLQLFLFWELVGLCSYLLIGFWWYKPEAAAAGKKAWMFCVIGDFLFLLGIVILYKWMFAAAAEPITFSHIFAVLESGVIPAATLTAVSILILAGVCGKSAQFPLHGWIPDAMEGPTTVSALIHAATMVTAGIYLVARTFPIFIAAPHALFIVALVGGFTAILAATMGLVVNDLKRVLAYSTISQLGYMLCMLGVGAAVGALAIGYSVFHLISHAFFKALLFLCAGAILHALWNTRDIKEMGGIFKHMKITGAMMLIGALTLVGFPLTSGFYSKDKIVLSAYEYGSVSNSAIAYLPWLFLVFGVLLTATYTFRAYFLVFTGKPRSHAAKHPHEAPPVMLLPLVVLAACSLAFGALTQSRFYDFLSKTFTTKYATAAGTAVGGLNFENLAKLGENVLLKETAHAPAIVHYLPLIFALLGIGIAGCIYYNNRIDVAKYVKKENPLYKLVWNKYYLDYLYKDIIAEKFMFKLMTFWDVFDLYVIDGIVNGISRVTTWFGGIIRKVQTGDVQSYAASFILGMAILAIILRLWGA